MTAADTYVRARIDTDTKERASSFKRDYKREAKGRHRSTIDSDLKIVLVALATV